MEHYKNYENKSELMENINKVHERMLTTLWVINKTEKSLDNAFETENKDKIMPAIDTDAVPRKRITKADGTVVEKELKPHKPGKKTSGKKSSGKKQTDKKQTDKNPAGKKSAAKKPAAKKPKPKKAK